MLKEKKINFKRNKILKKELIRPTKIYAKENALFLNEFRRAFKNGFLTLDSSYTQGYKDTDLVKTKGSRNHIFAELDLDLAKDKPYDSNLSIKVQRTSNDTYFRVHDINTALVDEENTDLENKVSYYFSKNNMFLDISATIYENLREEDAAKKSAQKDKQFIGLILNAYNSEPVDGFKTFHGKYTNKDLSLKEIHESPMVMLIPLLILALGAIFSGYLFSSSGSFLTYWPKCQNSFKSACSAPFAVSIL